MQNYLAINNKVGYGGRTRTYNQQIQILLLYQLSYSVKSIPSWAYHIEIQF